MARRRNGLILSLTILNVVLFSDVITYEWAYTEDQNTGKRSYTPWSDFTMVKTCRNFDKVYAYLPENIPSVANELHDDIQKPADAPGEIILRSLNDDWNFVNGSLYK